MSILRERYARGEITSERGKAAALAPCRPW
jgi:uncharacterized membrane protein